MRSLVAPTIVLCAFALQVIAGESPIPDKAALAEAEKTIKEVFKDDYSKQAPADKLALAQKLLQQGVETKDLPARYVMLREATSLAAQIGNATIVAKAINETASVFEVDSVALKTDALARTGSAASTPETNRALAVAYLSLIDEAVIADNYEAAGRLATAAEGAARKAQNMPILTQVQSRIWEVHELGAEFSKVKASKQILAEKPDDPDSNTSMGKFLCF